MANLFRSYRALAFVVGVLLTILVFVGMPLKYLATEGSVWAHRGEVITSVVGVAHGWIYMAYLVVAFLLARRARWRMDFTILMLLAGLLPIVIFYVEHLVAQRVRVEHPEVSNGVPGAAPAPPTSEPGS